MIKMFKFILSVLWKPTKQNDFYTTIPPNKGTRGTHKHIGCPSK